MTILITGHSVAQEVTGFPLWQYESDPGSGDERFVKDKSSSCAGFLQVLWFPLPIFIPPTTAH
jgi:hypothetical protein